MNMVREAIERLYKGLCSVKVKVSSVNEETGETVFTEKAVLTEQPCRLSFQSRNSAAKDDGYSTISQSVVLFIAPEVEIPSGSKITVTQNGKQLTIAVAVKVRFIHHTKKLHWNYSRIMRNE